MLDYDERRPEVSPNIAARPMIVDDITTIIIGKARRNIICLSPAGVYFDEAREILSLAVEAFQIRRRFHGIARLRPILSFGLRQSLRR